MNRVLFLVLAALLFQAAAAQPKRVVVLGDSIAAGYGLDPDEAYPALLQEKIQAAKLNFTVVNAGVSGDTTAGGLRRIGWLLRQPVDVLVLELGGNDGLRGLAPDQTEKNLTLIIDKVREKNPAVQILLVGMQMPENMGAEFAREFREVFPRVAKEKKTELVPFLLERVAGRPELNQADRIHPTAEGQRIVAENIWKGLRPLLEKAEKVS